MHRRAAFFVALLLAMPARATPRGDAAEAADQLALGMKLYNEGHLDEAVAAIRAGYALDPRPDFHYALGQIERRRGHCLEAIRQYESYLAADPPRDKAAAARTQIERCRADLAAPATSPESRAELHFRAGEAAFRLGRYEDAIIEWKAGFALAPRALFQLDLGQAYRKLDDPHEALAAFERFLSLAPAEDPQRAGVEREVELLRAEAARRPRLAAPLGMTTPRPAVAALARPAHPSRSFARRHWWIFPIAAVAATGLAVGLGVGLTAARANHLDCAGAIVCLTESRSP